MTEKNGLPASAFLVVGDPEDVSTWHLPVKNADGTANHTAMGQAWAALHGGFRGNPYAGPNKAEALAKLTALYKSEGMDTPKQADDPGMADVHVPAPIGVINSTRSPLLRKLVRRLRSHLKVHGAVSGAVFEEAYRSALGHAGAMARKGAEAVVCPACANGDVEDCTCPMCDDNQPENCLCDQAKEDAATGQTTTPMHEVFLPHTFSAQDEWIPYLPTPGTFKHPQYGDVVMSKERNADFVAKFNAGVYQSQVPLDAEHQTKLSGAMGWIRQLRQNADGSADARVEWTDRGRSMLGEGRFKFISPEWFDTWRNPATGEKITNVAIGGALTTRPYFKESSLRPLAASEAGVLYAPELQEIEMSEDPQKYAEIERKLSEAAAQTAALEARLAEAEQAKTASEQALETERTASQQYAERIAAIEKLEARRAFTETAKPWFGDTEAHVTLLEMLPDDGRKFYEKQQNALAEQLRTSNIFSTIGVAGSETQDTPMGAIEAATTAMLAAHPDWNRSKAMAEAVKANPNLYEEYNQDVPMIMG